MEITYAPFSYNVGKKILSGLQNAYPFAEYSVLGASVAKHSIFSMSLGKGTENVLFISGLYADETAAPLILYRFFGRLCESYRSDGMLAGVKIRRTLQNRRVTVVPCLTPDAFEIRRFGAVGAGCYAGLVERAAGRSLGDWQSNARGVNVAHNFDYQFRPVHPRAAELREARPSPFSYAGPAPESEAETAALVRFCARENFRHSVMLAGSGKRVFWESPAADADEKDVPMTAKILAAAGNYTLSEKESAFRCGSFPAWFAAHTGNPAFEIAAGKSPRVSSQAEFDALYAQVEEMLVLAAIV